jgi:hypothetical protein
MTFTSYIFKPNPKKIKEDRMSLIYLFAIVAALLLIFALFFRGLLSFALFGSIAGGLIKLKYDEIKNKGYNRFGSLPSTFQLSAEGIHIGEEKYSITEVTDLEIDAEDFKGGPGGDIFSSSLGTDNVISFTVNGVKHEYQFVVKTRVDLKLLAQIKKLLPNQIAAV